MLIEQAIFTSTETDWSAGYRLVSSSAGVRDADAQELSAWGPSHDSLWEEGPDVSSVNFHRLPSGAYCISRTTPAGGEYSGRRGPKIYTQCLVVQPELLSRFSNNPFALLRAVVAQGALRVHDPIPANLTPIRLVGRAAPFDQSLVAQLTDEPGVDWLATLLQALLDEQHVGVIAESQAQRLVQGVVNCLPPECRPAFTFSTGLRYSPRRPYRLVCLPPARTDARRLERRFELRVLDLSGNPPREFAPREGWAGFVSAALARRKAAWFGSQLAHSRPDLSIDELNGLGRRLLAQMAEHHVDEPVCATGTADASSAAWLDRIGEDLKRQPHDRGVWQAWQKAQLEALERGDLDGAATLVRRACEILTAARIPLLEATNRVRSLLEMQIDNHPDALTCTLQALASLPAETGRDAWLTLASQLQGAQRPTGARRKVSDQAARELKLPPESLAPRASRVRRPSPVDWEQRAARQEQDVEPDERSVRQAHAAHRRFQRTGDVASQANQIEALDATPAEILGRLHPEALSHLEALDDTVFDAIAGKTAALDELRRLWPQAEQQLTPAAVHESREQYLRHALAVWRHCVDGEEIRDPQRAIRALDVLSILFDT